LSSEFVVVVNGKCKINLLNCDARGRDSHVDLADVDDLMNQLCLSVDHDRERKPKAPAQASHPSNPLTVKIEKLIAPRLENELVVEQ
jgi:hypothetical protein